MTFYTPLVVDDNLDPETINSRFEELRSAVRQLETGELTQTTPDIDSLTNATHDHKDAEGGGQVTVDAIDAESSTAGQVMATDGEGGFDWSTSVGTILGFTDTASKYIANGFLRIDASESVIGIGAVARYIYKVTSDYTTSSNAFVDVDSTNLKAALTTGGGDVLVGFVATLKSTSGTGIPVFDLDVDGTRLGGDGGIAVRGAVASGNHRPILILHLITGLAPGSHTIKLQWKTAVASTTIALYGGSTANYQVHPQFFALEVA